jgi:EthD domain
MFRMISLLKRKPGLTHRQFRDHFESRHRQLRESAIAGFALSYERYYLYPMNEGDAAPIYDGIAQICFQDRDACERCGSALENTPQLAGSIAADEEAFIERTTSVHFEAQDSCSNLQAVDPGETLFRTVWFARRRPGMTHEQAKDYYENKHRLVGEYLVNGYAHSYVRRYLHRLAPDAPEPHYTFITEINFPSRERFEEMAAVIAADGTIAQFVIEDEQRFIDRGAAVHYTAESAVSVLHPLRTCS